MGSILFNLKQDKKVPRTCPLPFGDRLIMLSTSAELKTYKKTLKTFATILNGMTKELRKLSKDNYG